MKRIAWHWFGALAMSAMMLLVAQLVTLAESERPPQPEVQKRLLTLGRQASQFDLSALRRGLSW